MYAFNKCINTTFILETLLSLEWLALKLYGMHNSFICWKLSLYIRIYTYTFKGNMTVSTKDTVFILETLLSWEFNWKLYRYIHSKKTWMLSQKMPCLYIPETLLFQECCIYSCTCMYAVTKEKRKYDCFHKDTVFILETLLSRECLASCTAGITIPLSTENSIATYIQRKQECFHKKYHVYTCIYHKPCFSRSVAITAAHACSHNSFIIRNISYTFKENVTV